VLIVRREPGSAARGQGWVISAQPATSSGVRGDGLTYCAGGRTSVSSCFCSRMCADQPAVGLP
jgi:hypothetical protein